MPQSHMWHHGHAYGVAYSHSEAQHVLPKWPPMHSVIEEACASSPCLPFQTRTHSHASRPPFYVEYLYKLPSLWHSNREDLFDQSTTLVQHVPLAYYRQLELPACH